MVIEVEKRCSRSSSNRISDGFSASFTSSAITPSSLDAANTSPRRPAPMTKPAISFAGGSALGGATEARDRAGRTDTRPVGCAATDGTVGIATTPICHVLARLNSAGAWDNFWRSSLVAG